MEGIQLGWDDDQTENRDLRAYNIEIFLSIRKKGILKMEGGKRCHEKKASELAEGSSSADSEASVEKQREEA